jgi:hypothetical protein
VIQLLAGHSSPDASRPARMRVPEISREADSPEARASDFSARPPMRRSPSISCCGFSSPRRLPPDGGLIPKAGGIRTNSRSTTVRGEGDDMALLT